MNLVILRTDITNSTKVKSISAVFDSHPRIIGWSVDTDDIDNVLRIEGSRSLKESEVIQIINKMGYNDEDLDC